MRKGLFYVLALLLPVLAQAQTTPPPTPTPTAAPYSVYPPGMRVQAGQAVLPRNTPSAAGTCGSPAHTCTGADAIPPSTYGVIQPDAPVLDAAGWYWQRITWENNITGWTGAYSPYVNNLTPAQMIVGSSFNVIGDYSGPTLTQATCINDGVNSAATLQLQLTQTGHQGTLLCPWKSATQGNHKVVITAINTAGSAPSTEFQFSVTAAVVPATPAAPGNLRIGPLSGTTTLQFLDTAGAGAPAAPGTKPAPQAEKPTK